MGELAGLDRDMGVYFEGMLDPSSVRDLSDYVLSSFLLKSKRPDLLLFPVEGDLFAYPEKNQEDQSFTPDSRIKLNIAPVLGRIVIFNNINKEPTPFPVDRLGVLGWYEEVSVRREFTSILSLLKLDDVSISTELQPDRQVKVIVGVEFQYQV